LTQIVDTGEGINPKGLKDLFQTFNKEKLAVFKSQGIGIGLSTAKELSTTLGGGIELMS